MSRGRPRSQDWARRERNLSQALGLRFTRPSCSCSRADWLSLRSGQALVRGPQGGATVDRHGSIDLAKQRSPGPERDRRGDGRGAGRSNQTTEIAERSGLGLADVEKALAALWVARPQYLEGYAPEEKVYPVLITGRTERALRDTEQWPSPTGIVDALVAAFEREADMELDQGRRSRLWAIAEGLRGFARDVAVNVISNKLNGL